jgi:hypothetical protein
MVMEIPQPIIRERDHIKHACVNINPEARIPINSVELEISYVRYIFTICGINMTAENPPPKNPVISTHDKVIIKKKIIFLMKVKLNIVEKKC